MIKIRNNNRMQIIIRFHKIGGNQYFIKEISKKQVPLKAILLHHL